VLPGLPHVPGPSEIVGGITRAGIQAALSGISAWVAAGASWLVAGIAKLVDAVTKPAPLDFGWFGAHFTVMAEVSACLVLPLLLASVVSAIVRQDPGLLVRAVALHLPLAAIGTAVAMQVVDLALAATDQLCLFVAGATGSHPADFLTTLGSNLQHAPELNGAGEFGVVVVAVVLVLGSLGLAIELIVRTTAIYVAMLFLPLALAGMVWPATMRWARRLIELLAVLILSKFVIVAVLSLGAAATVTGFDHGDLTALIGGGALLVLAAFAPFTLLRLVPIVEAGAIGHLEGAGRQALAARPGPSKSDVLDRALESAAGPSGEGSAPFGLADDPQVAPGEMAKGRHTVPWAEAESSLAASDAPGGMAGAEAASGTGGAAASGGVAGAAPAAAVAAPIAVAAVGVEAATAVRDRVVEAGDKLAIRLEEERAPREQ
jgi:hypothetical protein